MLAKSGACNGTIIRIRADNVIGVNLRWVDVGIAPQFNLGAKGKRGPSTEYMQEAKLELGQRFLFLILEGASRINDRSNREKFGFVASLLSDV